MANFSISQSGNNINISSDGVTINVTQVGSIANILAPGYAWDVSAAGSLASIKLVPKGSILRNSFQAFYNSRLVNNSLEYTSPKDASGVSGTITHIHANDASTSSEYISPGSIVRNGDYIYLYYRSSDESPYELSILEYKISTGATNSIIVCTNVYGSFMIATGYGTSIAVIEDRKLLVCDNGDYDPDAIDPMYHVYIVDFAANLCTETLTFAAEYGTSDIFHHLQNCATIKDDNGDIHLIVSSTHADNTLTYTQGFCIYHKNYTNNSSWTETILMRDTANNNSFNAPFYPYVISDNRYFCVFTKHINGTSIKYVIYSFDISTDTLIQLIGGGSTVFPQGKWNANEDGTNHKIYITISFDNGVTKSLYEFDPVACTLSSNIVDTFPWVVASNTHTFDWDNANDIYRSYDQNYINNLTRPTNIENLCTLADDNGVIWYMSGANLKAYNPITGIEVKSIATGLTGSIGIVHIGDALILTTVDGSGSVVDYYLVT
jgi:hypothetical protein